MAQLIVVNGALLECTRGSQPAPLRATRGADVTGWSTSVAATILDVVPGTNIPSFGTCNKTGSPCRPSTPRPWSRCARATEHLAEPLVTADATLGCDEDGWITIADPGQSKLAAASAPTQDFLRAFLLRVFASLGDPALTEWVNESNLDQLLVLYGIFRYPEAQAQAKEILGGAHVLIHDGNELYDMLHSKGRKRVSSHDTYIDDDDCIGLALPTGAVLVGKDKGGEGTRIQLEEHDVGIAGTEGQQAALDAIDLAADRIESIDGVDDIVPAIAVSVFAGAVVVDQVEEAAAHGGDYVSYVGGGEAQNQGPFGTSSHKDGNPIHIHPPE